MNIMNSQKRQNISEPKLRKHLNADSLFENVYNVFGEVTDHRTGNSVITLQDTLMSGFAMFSLKDPSLLAFDKREKIDGNLKSIYHIQQAPSDTYMRTLLDEVNPYELRPAFKKIFHHIQRGKLLEKMVFFKGCYLLALDGTGYFSSKKISNENCMVKVSKKTGEETYYQQMLGAAIIHPNFKEVIPLSPEFIIKQDGQTKNDCERNAAKRFFEKLREDYPRLPFIITEDSLNSNAPHIKEAEKYNLHYILGVKKGDHSFLFKQIEDAINKDQINEFEIIDDENPTMIHRFRFLNQVPLNPSNQDVLINFLEYWEITPEKTKHFSYVTDFTITQKNAFQIMVGGRTRWKIENETFNTLKNQGYHFEHNFGLGKNYLRMRFAMLMMLAFLVDQTQQLSCNLFQAVWQKAGSKRTLWERIRSLFFAFEFESMAMIYQALFYGFKRQAPIILHDSS